MDGETIFRVLVGGVLSVAPTILFLGLWRGLMALRDDDLINRTMSGEFGTIPESPISAMMFGRNAAGRESAPANVARIERVRCPSCAEPNTSYAAFCRNCLEKLR
ncbi:zinc ribbon domain-containing protein [Haladaptatus salinisoli]|uniref:zinc ribbon domain-containing protein n=1 Tax=Haladaptatus salinisoli TaxID=2884876 RepID=UPI001D0BB2DB|nr:zinc ribbon domain-containing protein [Haladaptatus salinisoli]